MALVVQNVPEIENNKYPQGSFMTCSNDNTVRIWNIDNRCTGQTSHLSKVCLSEANPRRD